MAFPQERVVKATRSAGSSTHPSQMPNAGRPAALLLLRWLLRLPEPAMTPQLWQVGADLALIAAGAGAGQPRMLLLVALQAAVEAGDADRCCRVLLAAARGLAAEGHRREAQRVLNLAQAHLGAKDFLRADLAAAWREFEQEESNA